VLSSIVAVVLCAIAFAVAYGRRENRNIFLGTACFAIAVCSVHFLAMAGTGFVAVPSLNEFGPTMSNEVLALGVIFSSFVLLGTFLWVSVTYLVPGKDAAEPRPVDDAPAHIPTAQTAAPELQIPCERDGSKVYITPDDVALVRADGHYTQIYTEDDRLFCVWPITRRAARRSWCKLRRISCKTPVFHALTRACAYCRMQASPQHEQSRLGRIADDSSGI